MRIEVAVNLVQVFFVLGVVIGTVANLRDLLEHRLIELGALSQRDNLSPLDKQDRRLSFAYWDTHPYRAARAARIRETLEEIEFVRSKGYARPLPPELILEIQDSNESFHTLEELVRPLP